MVIIVDDFPVALDLPTNVELEVIETEGREVHVMQAGKRVGAKLYAMDMPLDKVDTLIEAQFHADHIKNYKQTIDTKQLPYVLWELNDIFHYPLD